MNSTLNHIIDLKKRVLLLVSKYVKMKQKVVVLEEENLNLETKLKSLQNQVKDLEKRVEVVDVVRGIDLNNSDSIYLARKRVNDLIREIDKCISLLNN